MGLQSGESRPIRADAPRLAPVVEVSSYGPYTDEQLLADRTRLRDQSDQLAANPGRSPGVAQLLASIEQEIERISEELLQRARSRHPSSRSMSTRSPRAE